MNFLRASNYFCFAKCLFDLALGIPTMARTVKWKILDLWDGMIICLHESR